MNTNKNNQLKYFFITVIAATLGAVFILTSLNFSSENSGDDFPQGYKIITPEIPGAIDFAGEKVPLENFEVYERV
ncbi:MAG: hypothetical protein R3321_14610, partial [Nitrososphaeraceae archaeon]|nr:hypothetical protein [Nitrososphaeraceae archaeon]